MQMIVLRIQVRRVVNYLQLDGLYILMPSCHHHFASNCALVTLFG